MGLVTVERRGGAAVMTYANPPFGTMTAAGAQEMLEAFRPLSADPAVRRQAASGDGIGCRLTGPNGWSPMRRSGRENSCSTSAPATGR